MREATPSGEMTEEGGTAHELYKGRSEFVLGRLEGPPAPHGGVRAGPGGAADRGAGQG